MFNFTETPMKSRFLPSTARKVFNSSGRPRRVSVPRRFHQTHPRPPNATERNRTTWPGGAAANAHTIQNRTKQNDFRTSFDFDHAIPTTYDDTISSRSIFKGAFRRSAAHRTRKWYKTSTFLVPKKGVGCSFSRSVVGRSLRPRPRSFFALLCVSRGSSLPASTQNRKKTGNFRNPVPALDPRHSTLDFTYSAHAFNSFSYLTI